ncbi:lytic transglycosylase domain-containing protein [Rhodobaculum claviforme]|uniref:Transglycosylase SLT domain-containing protein n=1 Tax=Rhodobaculum claviforme TaxID=1549854 RepID=A0A934WHV4_9RHOB|nr:lytic transglycosylase domain-containing protein [Rhodobaculum claviforme]MBK5926191.1 hypothetical protein [Rhodobaculum claviforme]
MIPVSPTAFLRAALAAALLVPALSAPAQEAPPPQRAAGLLGSALEEGAAGGWARAGAIAAPAGAVAQAVVEWHRLRAGDGDWRAVSAFAAAHPDWPEVDRFHARAESTLSGSAPPQGVIAFFEGRTPATGAGAVALAAARAATGDSAGATAAAVQAWRTLTLSEVEERSLLAAHGTALAGHHDARLDMLLWRRDRTGAARQAARMDAGAQALAAARLALAARDSGVTALIAAVPRARADDPGLAFDRFDWRMHNALHESAGDLLLERSDAGTLGRPEAWARSRAFLARQALGDGDARRAWRLAAGHGLDSGGAFADMEWFAGFVALRYLDAADTALRHFQRLRVGVSAPISVSRAAYWEGRAREALGEHANAAAAYAFAAEHATTFYGQLAAERTGLPMPAALAGPDGPVGALPDHDLLRAALLLRGAGHWHRARQFFLALGTAVDAPGRAALARHAVALGEENWAVTLGRVTSGDVPVDAAFPLHPMARMDLPVPTALALAISRRESEFDPAVVSPADARGLMQVLPGTGRDVARRLGVAFEDAWLTTDPALNVRLGATYLAELTERFGPGLALVAAGYNAGPARPPQWIARLGDPRDMDDDALIDWIERVPFAETRNYIMRVTESKVVYRARLAGRAVPFDVLVTLRGR